MAGHLALKRLAASISIGNKEIVTRPDQAVPSFCSSATYLVFINTLQKLIERGDIRLDAGSLKALKVAGQSDGEGVWGRWNANGPGSARLFHELGLGRNFLDFSQARPGDFMKIFWSQEIGKFERGHSVVFLGIEGRNGAECVRFWSSNMPVGYGEKVVPRSKIAQAIFSRLERPGNIAGAGALRAADPYLASMLTRRSSLGEVREKCGM